MRLRSRILPYPTRTYVRHQTRLEATRPKRRLFLRMTWLGHALCSYPPLQLRLSFPPLCCAVLLYEFYFIRCFLGEFPYATQMAFHQSRPVTRHVVSGTF
jgi:hypothetical protein